MKIKTDQQRGRVVTHPSATIALIREAGSENPMKQIFGVVRDIREAETEAKTIYATASNPREIQTRLDDEYAMGAQLEV